MNQQVAVVVLVDVAAALESRTLEGSIHLLDNARLQGSVGQGSADLITAINGSYWSDGSQADEQVINWALYSLGSIPPTVPRGYLAAERGRGTARTPARAGGTSGGKPVGKPGGKPVGRVADITGGLHTPRSGWFPAGHAHPEPVLGAIVGEAVDKGVLHPAVYGSPDQVTDGWYWSASVDTTRPGTYGYTMRIELHEPVESDGQWRWEPVRLAYDSAVRIRTAPKRNGFTKAGLGTLPIRAAAAGFGTGAADCRKPEGDGR
ncbi:hypothetical protein OG896_10490 [Streptomyces sp. NBC_00669]|uniref:hypothetical protein n=1 Tax=Streptomyces sp. NBC_00669 TaxID=2976011 RepID=UPI002E312EDC|nr:hypothetical protein [Streptomyces sp. NBC_00669]